MTTALDIMTTNIITIKPTDSMLEAYRLMRQHQIRHLPVFNEQKLVGILSDRDVQRAMVVHQFSNQQEIVLTSDKKVMDYMNWPVFTISEKTSLKRVVEEVLTQKVSAFVVENDEGVCRGIVTTDDLLAHLLHLLEDNEDLRAVPVSLFLNTNTLY